MSRDFNVLTHASFSDDGITLHVASEHLKARPVDPVTLSEEAALALAESIVKCVRLRRLRMGRSVQ